MTSVRIHLYYANEFDMDKIWDLLLKFFKIDQYYRRSSSGPICSYVQHINFRDNEKRFEIAKKANTYVEVGVLDPKKSELDLKQEFDEIQRSIFENLAKTHEMMDVFKNGPLNF